MKYPCLVLDHDDTVVNSTATIHYPCFVEFLARYRPGQSMTLTDYFLKNFDPGFLPMCREVFGMTDEELRIEQDFWHRYVDDHIPAAYDGMRELLWSHVNAGGTLCVVSHSMRAHILRDWAHNGLPEPALIFGWDERPEHRKPHPYPLLAIMERLGFRREELLMVDDLKPGYEMARAAGVDFVGAGWATSLEPMARFLRANSTGYAPSVAALAAFLEEKTSPGSLEKND